MTDSEPKEGLLWRLVSLATSTEAKTVYALVVFFAAVIGGMAVSYLVFGLISTILNVVLFVFALTLFPVSIMLLGAGMPFGAAVGKLHLTLSAFAFDYPYLVQTEDKYLWCPGTKSKVFVDGEWHEIVGGEENRSVLGWRPFGILRYKTKETLSESRADTLGERTRGTSTDGGSVERGGFVEVDPPAISGIDGNWLLDLKRVFSRGVKAMGSIEVIEKEEEIVERGQLDEQTFGSWQPIVTFIVSLLLGIGVGYLTIFA